MYDQERRVGGGTGAIYDVSKTSIRRSLTPIVAFHAVRVSLPKLYCRKADFTRAGSSLPSVRDHPPPLLQGGITVGVVTSARGVLQHADVLRRISRAGWSRSPPPRHPFLSALPRVSPRARNACRCSRYTVRVVNACIFLN